MLAKENQKMTLAEFDQLEENNEVTYELIDGIIMMTPRPNFKHQSAQTNLIVELGAHFKGKPCSVMGETEIQLGDNVLVPDIFIYCDKSKLTAQRHIGAPAITIEILSPSTAFYDLNRKIMIYEQYSVQEYWIVNPKTETITVHHFGNKTTKEYGKADVLVSDVFEDLKINIIDVFAE